MIQYIALAVALDASATAHDAQNEIDRSRVSPGGGGMLIVRPVRLRTIWRGPKAKKTDSSWTKVKKFFSGKAYHILEKQPWAELALNTSHIENLSQRKDDDLNKYVVISISHHAGVENSDGDQVGALCIPGTLEDATAVVNKARGVR